MTIPILQSFDLVLQVHNFYLVPIKIEGHCDLLFVAYRVLYG